MEGIVNYPHAVAMATQQQTLGLSGRNENKTFGLLFVDCFKAGSRERETATSFVLDQSMDI